MRCSALDPFSNARQAPSVRPLRCDDWPEPGANIVAKKAGCHTAGNEGATQNGEGLDCESLAAQTFPLRGPRRQRHLNN